MGYTHSWNRPQIIEPMTFDAIGKDLLTLLPALDAAGSSLANAYGREEPEIGPEFIGFNGVSCCGMPGIHSSSFPGQQETPAFDPRDWKSSLASKPTEVLTLDSPHLSQIATTVNDALMTDLLDKLAVFHPEFITIEDVSGEQCDHFKRYASVYPGSFEAWCFDPVAAQKPSA